MFVKLLIHLINRDFIHFETLSRLYDRKAAMLKESELKITDPSDLPSAHDGLSSDLLYHVKLLMLLSNTNLGPKMQAIYPVEDVIDAILDTATIPVVKQALGRIINHINSINK